MSLEQPTGLKQIYAQIEERERVVLHLRLLRSDLDSNTIVVEVEKLQRTSTASFFTWMDRCIKAAKQGEILPWERDV
ncbi:MAG: hypothetical protein KAS32_05560 [Candidatus Peribacteraceae bacterium]|nr:hypothetical protein [Candidatus Peribacteraceae bacterium]